MVLTAPYQQYTALVYGAGVLLPITSLLRAALGLPLGLALLPLMCAGWVRLYYATTRAFPGLKMTALKIVTVRAELHAMGLREDPASAALLRSLPWVPAWARQAIVSHLPLASLTPWFAFPLEGRRLERAMTADKGVGMVVALRSQLIDRTLRASASKQLVILGAGLDTRAHGALGAGRRVFEVDLPATQAAKREAVRAAGLDDSHVTYVGVDFDSDGGASWLDQLVAAGFDRAAPAVYIWEGVTYYLPEAAVDQTVELVKQCAPGTVLALDYFTAELVSGELFPFGSRELKGWAEPLRSWIGAAADEEPARAWAEAHGLILRDWMCGGPKGARWGGACAVEVR